VIAGDDIRLIYAVILRNQSISCGLRCALGV
jgi:hypothetical protein